MPIFKSKKYMDSPKEGFSIAMGVKRRAPKHMASGGMVPSQEQDSSPVSIADAIMRKRKPADTTESLMESAFYDPIDADTGDIYADDEAQDSSDMGSEGMDVVSAIRKRMQSKRSE